MADGSIAENYRRIREELPGEVDILVAAKGCNPGELAEVMEAGARIFGENYVQEAEAAVAALGERAGAAHWHMIGHLQRNKVSKALDLFDLVQTVDSARLAGALNNRAAEPLGVLVEVNIAGEESKSGVAPGEVLHLLKEISALDKLQVEGLMTMEPYFEDSEMARPYFVRMRGLFEKLRGAGLPNVDLRILSMGMSNSWRVAAEEGASMVRLGRAIFGPRGT
jgi:pyridoxal phosphate enzyme (YggS family)